LLVTAPAQAQAFEGTYVALGDSYTSGPGIPVQRPDSGLCGRSDRNYPSLLATAIRPAAFKDVSCSGAITDNMTQSQFGAPPQFDALDSNTRLVTLGIGGNDADFVGTTTTCLFLGLLNPQGAPCKERFTAGGTDQLLARINQVAPKIDAVLQGIKARAPQARVLLVGYPDLLPDAKSKCTVDISIGAGDFPYLYSINKAMNQMLATRAAANRVEYVDTFTSSIGHDGCQSPGTRYIEPVIGVVDGAPIHPNPLGMRNTAGQVQSKLAALRVRS
jgi:lysophospholipase L1-like esterase